MTVDEIFSSESEHLYFRLIAARNALNAADDDDTRQVLNDILDETLNNIDRIGTDEEIAAAEEIVVRKSNKNVKEYLSCQKVALITTAIMFVTGVGAALAILLIIIGSNDKVKPLITVGIIAAFIIGICAFVSKFMRKRMNEAKEQLKGKTVIGCKINTGVKSSSSSSSSSSSKKSSSSSVVDGGKAKVVINIGGIIKPVIIIGVLAVLGFMVYTKWDQIVDSAKTIMFNIGLYNPAPDENNERWQEINTKLVNTRRSVNYNEAVRLFEAAHAEEDKEKAVQMFLESADMYDKCYGYNDEIGGKIEEANNCAHYIKADILISTSMDKAYKELKQIKQPFKNIQLMGRGIKDVDVLISQYSRHLDYMGEYTSGDETIVITDFARRNNALFIVTDKFGEKKVSTEVDREGYTYLLDEKKGDTVVKWYITTDHVLKVSESEEGTTEVQLRKKIKK